MKRKTIGTVIAVGMTSYLWQRRRRSSGEKPAPTPPPGGEPRRLIEPCASSLVASPTPEEAGGGGEAPSPPITAPASVATRTPPPPPSASAAAGTKKKTVYLIRHAESLENERSASLQRSASALLRLRRPSRSDVLRASELFDVRSQVDSDVSDVGSGQIENVAAQLREDDFLERRGVKLVAHSPLKRARQTSEGMLGCVAPARADEMEWASRWGGYNSENDSSCVATAAATASDSDCSDSDSDASLGEEVGGKRSGPVGRVEELPCLLEKAAAEWVPGNSAAFEARIATFENWLSDQPETVVAVVGHSQFFRYMLGLDYLFGNCDVWEVTWDPPSGIPAKSVAGSQMGVAEATEEKKDDSAVSSETEGSDLAGLPRGWSNLKKLYKCEQKGTEEEKGAES